MEFNFLLFFVFVLIIVSSSSNNCQNGSVSWNSNCYLFQANATEFATAEIACKRDNGNLVSIHDAFTNALLAGEAPNYFQQSTVNDFWIGATTMMKPGNWSWMDNSVFDFTDWEKGQPQNVSGLSCVAISITTGAWSSQDCIKANPYVCEITPKPTTNPPYFSCDPGWIYFEPTESCYGLNGTVQGHIGQVNWTTAEKYCQKFGAHLASIHDYEELKLIDSFDSFAWVSCPWIGLYFEDFDNKWKFTDNTPSDYQPWVSGSNINGTLGCTIACAHSAAIQPYNCSETKLFVCKKSVIT